MSDLTWLTPTPHATAVYASCSALLPRNTRFQAARYGLTWAGLAPAGSRQLWLAPYSITSSARSGNPGGMLNPSAFAVFMLTDQLVLGRCLNREIARLLAPQDAIDVGCRPSPLIDLIGPVGHQAALGCEIPKRIDRRQAMPRRQYDDRCTVRYGVGMRHDDQAAIRLAGKGGNRALDLAAVMDVDGSHRDPKRRRDRLGRAQDTQHWRLSPNRRARPPGSGWAPPP